MLISIEGVDHAGKTTQMKLLHEYAEKNNKPWLFTRNPGGTSLGEKLREIILYSNDHISEKAELMIYMADRAQHVEEFIKPALKCNQVVICDRYIDSTVAYQGYGRGIDIELIKRMNKLAIGGVLPELTILLTVSEKVAEERSKNLEKDRLEKENKLFFIRVRNGYMSLAREEPLRFQVIDTDNKNPQQVHEIMIKMIEEVTAKGLLGHR